MLHIQAKVQVKPDLVAEFLVEVNLVIQRLAFRNRKSWLRIGSLCRKRKYFLYSRKVD